MAPSSSTILSRRSASSFIGSKEKARSAFAETGFTRVSLAAFITRPQAEHQIGAACGILPINACDVNGL
jgi:hypothetical protein